MAADTARTRWRAAVPAALAAMTLTACGSDPVDVTPPEPPAEVAAACGAFAGSLPAEVEGRPGRAVRPESPLTAAWGTPAIVVRCGVPRPDAYAPDSTVFTVNGVDWLPERTEWGYVFTSVGRTADVEVRVPAAYAPEVNPLVDIAAAVSRTL